MKKELNKIAQKTLESNLIQQSLKTILNNYNFDDQIYIDNQDCYNYNDVAIQDNLDNIIRDNLYDSEYEYITDELIEYCEFRELVKRSIYNELDFLIEHSQSEKDDIRSKEENSLPCFDKWMKLFDSPFDFFDQSIDKYGLRKLEVIISDYLSYDYPDYENWDNCTNDRRFETIEDITKELKSYYDNYIDTKTK